MRVRQRGADIAVVTVEFKRWKPSCGDSLALLFCRLGLLQQGCKILAVGMCLADRGIDVDLIEGCVGHLVGQGKALRERQADGTRQGELILLERVVGHDQLLLERLRIHTGTQFIEQRRGSSLMV